MINKNKILSGLLLAGLIVSSSVMAQNILQGVEESSDQTKNQKIVFTFKDNVTKSDISSFAIGAPPKLSMEMKNTKNMSGTSFYEFKRQPARSISFSGAGTSTRAVVDFDGQANHVLSVSGKKVSLVFDTSSTDKNVVMSSTSFRVGSRGESRLSVGFSAPGAVISLQESGDIVTVDIRNADLDSSLVRAAEISDPKSRIKSINVESLAVGSRMTIKKQPNSIVAAYQVGNEYVLEVFERNESTTDQDMKSSGQGLLTAAPEKNTEEKQEVSKVATLQVDPPKIKTVVKSKPAVPRKQKQLQPASRIAATTNNPERTSSPLSGTPVSFNFQDVPVRTVIQLIAEEAGMNVVVSDIVSGNVTLNLTKVPWERALDIVLRSKGLDKRKDGNVIWVGPQKELADYERSQAESRMALEVREELVTEYIAVNYGSAKDIAKVLSESKATGSASTSATSPAGSAAEPSSRGFLSPRGSAASDDRTNTLIVSDTKKKIEEVKQMLEILDRPVDQVLIEARVVIAVDSFAKSLGAKFGISDRNGIDPSNPGMTNDGGFLSNLGIPGATSLLNFSVLGSSALLDVELSAMQDSGLGEIVSNPRVITSNQKEAVIRQGEEIGYVTTQVTGDATVPQATVQFKEVLLELKVTPVITRDGRVFLTVYLKKDEVKSFISTPSGDVPQIARREVNTNVLIDNGETLVIGGVYEFKDRKDVSKVPFLGDLKFFGNLFKSTTKTAEKAELLVFITPKIMSPVNRLSRKSEK